MATLAALGGACAPPDTPPALDTSLPAAVEALLQPDTVRSARVGAGVRHHYLWSAEGPWAIHVVEADFRRCDLELQALQAAEREGGGRGHEVVSSMVARAGGALAAVNADFFTPEGTALGTEVVDGRVTAARGRPTVAWRPRSEPWMGLPRVVGDTLFGGWPVALEGGDGSTEAVGGFPELLDAGVRVGDLGVEERPSFAASRHPRTAVAYDPATSRLWLVVVDGRQAPYSVGMSLPELATLLEALGATEALNLDGGGSTVMVVRGRTVNRPSDETGERAVVNALALTRGVSGCPR
ncbi:MAG: phosphodiester glycosidase family protein [Longimicrobiales bacterium]